MMRSFARMFREAGQALDRLGCSLEGKTAFKEEVSRHRRLVSLGEKAPAVGASAFVAPSASIVGSVNLASNASVWYGAVVRGDVGRVSIGELSAIGNNSVVRNTNAGSEMKIGARVVVDSGAILTSCTLESDCRIGAGAVLGEGVVVQSQAIVAGGAVVPPGSIVKKGELWEGNPAVPTRQLSVSERAAIADSVTAIKDSIAAHEAEHSRTFAVREAEKARMQTEVGVGPEAHPLY